MNGPGCGPFPRLHLCIESPGQDLPMVAGAIEVVPDKVEDPVQDGRLTGLHNAAGVGHRKPAVAGGQGGSKGPVGMNKEDVRAEESGNQRAGRWGRDS